MGYLAGVVVGAIFCAIVIGGACVVFGVDPVAVYENMRAG